MAIRTSTLNQIKSLANAVGASHVSIAQVEEFASENGISSVSFAQTIRRNADKLAHGVYDLSAILGETRLTLPPAASLTKEDIVTTNDLCVNNVVALNTTTTTSAVATKPLEVAAVRIAQEEVSYIPSKFGNFVAHGEYATVRKVIASGKFLPLYIVGESGNGKTLSVEQACAVEGRELIIVNITNETSEEDLIGTFTLRDGNLIWVDGPVLVAARRGAILLCDEIDQSSPRLLCIQHILNGAKEYYVKRTGERVIIKDGFNVVATANTKGDGEGSDRYYGTGVVNEAFLERFGAIIEQTYPTETVERKILGNYIEDSDLTNKLVRFAAATRVAYVEGALGNHITTRRLVHIAKNFDVFGDVYKSIELAVNRFDAITRSAFLELWNASTVEEIVTPEIEPEPTSSIEF